MANPVAGKRYGAARLALFLAEALIENSKSLDAALASNRNWLRKAAKLWRSLGVREGETLVQAGERVGAEARRWREMARPSAVRREMLEESEARVAAAKNGNGKRPAAGGVVTVNLTMDPERVARAAKLWNRAGPMKVIRKTLSRKAKGKPGGFVFIDEPDRGGLVQKIRKDLAAARKRKPAQKAKPRRKS